MKNLLLLVGMLFCAITATAQYNQPISPNTGEDWSGSPRLLVQNGNAQEVELASTTVTGAIVGVIADINVRQVYVNHGTKPIEAVYVFPGSTRAAVYAMTMTVGNHIIRSVIREKEQARREYTAAKSQGRSASLLEMLKPNIFRMNVANVRPGDSIVIDMRYTEAIYLSENVYEFVYPAVVAPRYVGAVQTEVDAALSSKELPTEIPGKFSISLRLATGVMLKNIYSPSHDLDVDNGNVYTKKNVKMNLVSHCRVGISPKDSLKQNRDFVLRYSLSGRAIESGLLLYKGETENYFMLMAQPPRNVEIPSILPREFVFIVDVSGSMNGEPLNIANYLMKNLLTTLRPQDKFNIMTFSGGSDVFANSSVEATKSNVLRGLSFLSNNSQYGGGTELLPALKRALAMPSDENCSRSFVVITDGYVSIEREAFKLVRENLNKANIYAFGIGQSVNRYLMEGLARAGNADPMIITNMNETSTMADKFKQYIEAPVLTNIKIDYGNLDVYDVEPASIPDVTSQRPVIVFGKWRGKPYGTVTLTGTTADSTIDISMNIGALPMIAAHSALKYLWARNKIMMIEDGSNQMPTDEERKIITNIGLQYNLLTRYTSFVAIDSLTPVVAVRKSVPPRDTAREVVPAKKSSLPPSGPKGGDLTNDFPNPKIAEGAVKTNRIYDSAVTTQKLRQGSVTGAKIADGTNSDIDIVNNTIINSGIEAKAVRPSRLATSPSQDLQNRLLMGWGPTSADSMVWTNDPSTTETVLHWDGTNLNWRRFDPLTLNKLSESAASSTQIGGNRNRLLVGINPVTSDTMGWLKSPANAPANNGYVLRYDPTKDIIEWAPNNKLFFPIDGDTTINLSLAPAMIRLTNRGDGRALILENPDSSLSSKGLIVTLPEASATSKNKDAKQSTAPSTTKAGKSSASKKETNNTIANKTSSQSGSNPLLVPNVTDKLRFPVDFNTDDEKEDSTAPANKEWEFKHGKTEYKFHSNNGKKTHKGNKVTTNATSNKDEEIASGGAATISGNNGAIPQKAAKGKTSGKGAKQTPTTAKASRDKAATKIPVAAATAEDMLSKDTSSLQVASGDSISVQNGLSEAVPQGGISIRGSRSTEANLRVQGTDITDQVSGGNSGIQMTPSITEYSGSYDSIDDNADPLNPGKKKPRIYGGIITALTFGSLGKYEPNSLTGNALTGISHDTKIGYSTGVRLEYLLGDVKNSKSFITADVMFGRLGFGYSAQDSVQSMAFGKIPGKYQLTTTASAFTLNAQYTHWIPGTFLGVTAGLSTNYLFNIEHSYSVTADKAILPSASSIGTSDSGRTVQYVDAATNDINRLQLGIVVGLSYDILLGRAALTPFAQFEYGLNGILSGGKERPMMVRAGFSIIFAF